VQVLTALERLQESVVAAEVGEDAQLTGTVVGGDQLAPRWRTERVVKRLAAGEVLQVGLPARDPAGRRPEGKNCARTRESSPTCSRNASP
jgi:hypothetical protein